MADMLSFLSIQPFTYHIYAIEDSGLLLISRSDFEDMLLEVPVMERFFRILFQNKIISKERRLISIRVTAMAPSTLVTELAHSANLINNNEDRLMHPEDFAELIIAQLKLNRRVFVKDSSFWSTNP
jgi:CRP-like cAMP-binding protein